MKQIILDFLDEKFPNAHCELNYSNDYELLISIALSAQTTDKAVNIITKDLFLHYPNINTLAQANQDDIKNILRPLGLASVKSKNIISCAKDIVKYHNSFVPNKHEELIKLKSIGNKTANVFLAEYYNIPTFPVDTHVKRVSQRLNLTKSDNVIVIEKDLKNYFDKSIWIKLHHQLIFFGRYLCTSRNPKCSECKIKCNFSQLGDKNES